MINAEALEMLHDPNMEEYNKILLLDHYVVTSDQQRWLQSHGITLHDILNGQVHRQKVWQHIVEVFFPAWNATIGEEYFSEGGPRKDGKPRP